MTFQSTSCRWESRVMRAAETKPDAEVAAHLAGCSACRELFEVAGSMARMAQVTADEFAERRLPEAGQLWWKAQLMQRWEAEARATAPVDLMQRAEVIGGVLAGLALLMTMWPDVQKFEGATTGGRDWWLTVASLLEPSTFSAVMGCGVAVLGLLAVVTLRQLMAED